MTTHRLPTLAMFASLLLALAGCRDREIRSYRAPKDPAPPATAAAPAAGALPADHPPIGGQAAAPGGDMAGTPVATASGNALTWTAPAAWTAKPTGPVRKGSYAINGDAGAVADLAITAFPGDTGGLFANINRWRGQIGLPPIEQAQLDTAVQHLDIGAFHIDFADMLGTANGQPTRLLGAIVPHEGQTWFFKLTGPDALVSAQRAAFREFLATIKPAAANPGKAP